MKPGQRFSEDVLDAIRRSHVIGLRAGTPPRRRIAPHRFIAVWAVVVEKRVFIRSWSLKPNSWYHVFKQEPRGMVQVDGREVAVRAVHTRSERLKDAIDRAYLEKYKTPGSIKFVRDLRSARSRATTTELVPIEQGSEALRPTILPAES